MTAMCVSVMFRLFLLWFIGLALIGCTTPLATMAPAIAQPNTRPARNFTPFAEALRCMDDLLLKSGRRGTLISSTNIPDYTKQVSVGADDMLINALNQMNKKSRSYLFVDQAFVAKTGNLELQIVSDKDATPSLYIRGSISQVDANTTDLSLNGSFTQRDQNIPGFGRNSGGWSRTISVVTVDMHLVGYPSRRVLAGGSVANSMAVVSKGWGTGAKGLIENATLDLNLEISRVESRGQAVRNLVELGLIELIGKHAKVPYWTCLQLIETDARRAERDERQVTYGSNGGKIREAQEMLVALGRLSAPHWGHIDERTRTAIVKFQVDTGVLPNGIVDFDLLERLRKHAPEPQTTAGPASKISVTRLRDRGGTSKTSHEPEMKKKDYKPAIYTPKPTNATPTTSMKKPKCQPGVNCKDTYVSLTDYLEPKEATTAKEVTDTVSKDP